ncbi:MAG: cell wall-binding repeat-containing protein [Actinobacteria bacterium]|nr:MAG: cell wall-binding repeat-containing protein [Actinomycetota bacterium]
MAAGANRYETAVALANYLAASEGFAWGSVYVANTNALSDVLVCGPLAGRNRAPVLLVTQGVMPSATYSALDAHSATIAKGYVMGGTGAVSDPCRAAADTALK